MQTTPFRRRRSSKRRLSQARSPSHSRAQASHGVSGALGNFGNDLRALFTEFLLPLTVWVVVLGSVMLNVVTLLTVVSFLAEHANNTTDITPFEAPPWVAELSWPFWKDDVHTIDTDNPAEAILGDYTAIGTSPRFDLPSAQIDRARNAAEVTGPVIQGALSQVEKMDVTLLNREEVASLTREWDKRHKRSNELFRALLSEESAFRSHLLLRVRFLALFFAQHEDELVNSGGWEHFKARVPWISPRTPPGTITRDLKHFAHQQAKDAQKLAETALQVRSALNDENDTRESLKVSLPINWRELGEDIDFQDLQTVLQQASEVWIQNALEVANTFRKRYTQLSVQYWETFTFVRETLGNGKDRAAWLDYFQANMARIKQSLAESESKLAAISQE